MMRTSDDTSPTVMPTTAPVVVKRRQVSASSSAGKLALAATANVSPVSSCTLKPGPASSASAAPTAPMPTTAIRATRICSASSSAFPRFRTFAHRSWATAPDAASTTPATTARIVANAIAEMTAKKMSPPTLPDPPPSSWAR